MTAGSNSPLIELLDRARGGDADALGQLLENYRAYLALIARVEIHPRLQAKVAPSDLVQETFKNAKRGFSDFRGQNEPELVAWLRRILATQLAMHLRAYTTQQRDVRLEVRLEDSLGRSSFALAAALKDEGSSPSQRASKRERAVIVADALVSLPADMREVLILRHLESHTFPQIAERLDRPLENVKSMWRRGIIRLRESVIDQLEE